VVALESRLGEAKPLEQIQEGQPPALVPVLSPVSQREETISFAQYPNITGGCQLSVDDLHWVQEVVSGYYPGAVDDAHLGRMNDLLYDPCSSEPRVKEKDLI
jgi:hypothetical protein